jgi:hypothetical protein
MSEEPEFFSYTRDEFLDAPPWRKRTRSGSWRSAPSTSPRYASKPA